MNIVTPVEHWLADPRYSTDIGMDLFALPGAGAGPGSLQSWIGAFPDQVTLRRVLLPGREKRFAEPAMASLGPLTDQLVDLLGRGTQPYALFGHSLGALLWLEVCRCLAGSGRPLPLRLYLSAVAPPGVGGPDPSARSLTDEEILSDISGDDASRSRLARVMLPTVRADYSLAEEALLAADAWPLDLDIRVYLGIDDPATASVPRDGWWTIAGTGTVTFRTFAAGHDLLDSHAAEIAADLCKDLKHLQAI